MDREPIRSEGLTHLSPFWKVDREYPQPEVISLAASVLKKGGVIIYPTETFYGLGGDPMSEDAVRRIYQIKGRDVGKPLPLIAGNMGAVRRAVADWPPIAERLAKGFWPGALALVLPASHLLSPLVHANTGKVAIRISSHPVARAISQAAGGLLIATSANEANKSPCWLPEGLSADLVAKVDGVLDAGPSQSGPKGLPSTIVDVSCMPPRLIRTGCLPWEKIECLLC